jgi:alpha-L-fucosidase 2
MSSRSAWSALPAESWEQGLVAGTGVVGAVVWGDPSRHVVAVSHESFFIPVNSRRPAPDLAPALPAIRGALAAGDAAAAGDHVAQRLREIDWDPEQLIWTDPLGPIAQMVWSTDDRSEDYRRVIPLDEGGVAVSWGHASGRAGLTVRARRGASHLDFELWSDVELEGTLSLCDVTEARPGATTVETHDVRDSVTSRIERIGGGVELRLHAAGVEPGTAAWARAQLTLAGNPSVAAEPDGWRVRLDGGVPVRGRIDIASSAAPAEPLRGSDAAALLRACRLRVGPEGEARADLPVEALWDSARRGDPAAERAVIETAFAVGRRNVVASSGHLPPTLQGVWQGTWSPAWSADYTLNGNVQHGSLAAVLWTGTPELMTSLFRLVLPHREDFRHNARAIFGAPGAMMPARMTTHGHANHFLRDYPHQFWIGGDAWFLRLAADYILVTGDRAPIDAWLWDFTVEALDFSLAVLADGEGRLSPSYSPENTPAGSDNPLATDATGDLAALRDGLLIGAWLAGLRADSERHKIWTDAARALPPPVVAADGTLAEWSGEWPENLAHRHTSQLHGLWYEPDPRLLEGPLRRAAEETVRRKIAWRAERPEGPPGRMEMAFGLASLGLAAAALGDAASAYQCVLWLARDHFTPALMSTHDAGAIFNVDASGALPAVVAAMLAGSAAGELRLLPALPAEWTEGEVTGLTVRGAARISRLSWSPEEVAVTIDHGDHGHWLRPAGTRVVMTYPVDVVSAHGVERLDEKTFLIPPQETSAGLVVRRRTVSSGRSARSDAAPRRGSP